MFVGVDFIVQANLNIKVTEDVKAELDKLKLHPREPYHEVIWTLIQVYQVLSEFKKKMDETKGEISEEMKEEWFLKYRFIHELL